jgi:hypothetical protein
VRKGCDEYFALEKPKGKDGCRELIIRDWALSRMCLLSLRGRKEGVIAPNNLESSDGTVSSDQSYRKVRISQHKQRKAINFEGPLSYKFSLSNCVTSEHFASNPYVFLGQACKLQMEKNPKLYLVYISIPPSNIRPRAFLTTL